MEIFLLLNLRKCYLSMFAILQWSCHFCKSLYIADYPILERMKARNVKNAWNAATLLTSF